MPDISRTDLGFNFASQSAIGRDIVAANDDIEALPTARDRRGFIDYRPFVNRAAAVRRNGGLMDDGRSNGLNGAGLVLGHSVSQSL